MLGTRRTALMGIVGLVLVAALLAGCRQSTGTGLKFAQSWTGTGADGGALDHPEGLAVDATGLLYIADTGNDRVVRCTAKDFSVQNTAGQRGVGDAQLESPRAVCAAPNGDMFVADSWNERVKKFSSDGKFLLRFGEKGVPLGNNEADGKWVFPSGVALDSRGNLYVADSGNHRIQKFDPSGKFLLKWGLLGRQEGQFGSPGALAMDAQDRLYVADVGNNRIQRFLCGGSGQPVFDTMWGGDGRQPGQFDRPYGLCVDAQGNSYVADFGNHRLQKFDPSGNLLYAFGTFGNKEGELDSPVAVAVDNQGAVFVSDWGNNRIQKFVPAS